MLGMNHNNNNFDTIAHDEVFYDEIHDDTIDNDNSNDKIAKFNNNNSSNNSNKWIEKQLEAINSRGREMV